MRTTMKNLLAIGLCFLIGCSESPVDENGRHIAEKSGDSFVVRLEKGGGEWSFTYVVVDGHEYLMMSGGTHRSGLAHSPKCECLKSHGAEIVIPYVTNSVPNLILEPTPVPL
jgi:hypothetical protein